MIVEARRLTRHPGEHPGVQELVLVEQLVPPSPGVRVDERFPQLALCGDAAGHRLELVRRQDAAVGNETAELSQCRHEEGIG